ncbi:MAG: rod shape-determining protein MreC [Bacteroidaceae bacterium]|nr:rod shape-determining protein MreC [Bacteroidaceae bacterium]
MQNLIDFILKYKYWFTFFLMEGFCLAILIRFNNYHGSVYFTTANSLVGGIYTAADGVTSYINLGTVNAQLEADNISLRDEVQAMKHELASHRIDTIKYEGFNRTRYKYIGAQIINATTNRSNNLLTLDKGSDDGIRPEMGVICSSGAVGIVYLTSAHYSIVMPLINVKSKISCSLKHHNAFGTMEWKFGDIRSAYMTGIPLHIPIDKDEIVETNGFSDIFPSGIPIGTVESTEQSTDGLAYTIKIRLAVDFASVRNVSVITNYNHAEKTRLEFQADSLMNI